MVFVVTDRKPDDSPFDKIGDDHADLMVVPCKAGDSGNDIGKGQLVVADTFHSFSFRLAGLRMT